MLASILSPRDPSSCPSHCVSVFTFHRFPVARLSFNQVKHQEQGPLRTCAQLPLQVAKSAICLRSPAASILLETLLPAENDVQVKTSVEPKDRVSKTRTRIETWPLATPGQKIFPIPSKEGSVVKQKSIYITHHIFSSLKVQVHC